MTRWMTMIAMVLGVVVTVRAVGAREEAVKKTERMQQAEQVANRAGPGCAVPMDWGFFQAVR